MRNGATSRLPALVDPCLVKALDHVLRQHILMVLVQREASPLELSEALGESLGQVSYHFRVLRNECGMIEKTRTVPRRGVIESYHRATVKTLLPAKTWRRLKKGLRAVIGAGQASDLFNDLAGALQAGKLQGAHDHIVRTPLALDVQGKRNVKVIAERATREMEDEQVATIERVERADGDHGKLTGYTFALLAFEAAWEPTDIRALVAGGDGDGRPSTNGSSRASQEGEKGKGSKRRTEEGKR